MLSKFLPDRTELLNHYCYIYEKSREDAEFIIDRALEAVRAEPELLPVLFSWLFGHTYNDVETDGYSLHEAACAFCQENPDVPTACYLTYLHRQRGMFGILACAGNVCEVSERVLYRMEKPYSFTKTGSDSWKLSGHDAEGQPVSEVAVDLWCMIEEYPTLLRCCLSDAEEGCVWHWVNGKPIRKDGDTDG